MMLMVAWQNIEGELSTSQFWEKIFRTIISQSRILELCVQAWGHIFLHQIEEDANEIIPGFDILMLAYCEKEKWHDVIPRRKHKAGYNFRESSCQYGHYVIIALKEVGVNTDRENFPNNLSLKMIRNSSG